MTLQTAPPHVIGIGGGVAAGKSTIAGQLAERFTELGRRVDIVATDAFLFPNAVLAERDLLMRKGFPETYDTTAMLGFVQQVHAGGSVAIPLYSHAIYDIVPDSTVVLENPDLVVLEGVVAVQPPIVDALDLSVYIDADEAAIRGWFVKRFVAFVTAAVNDGGFYSMFVGLPSEEVVRIAEATWDGINGVNLREHIAPARELATVVVRKAEDHSIVRIK